MDAFPMTVDLLPYLHKKADDEDAAPCQGQTFVRYCPGELLKKCVASTSMFVPPEHDNASECSTADTQSPHIESPRPTTATVSPAESPRIESRNSLGADVMPPPGLSLPEFQVMELPSVGSVDHGRGLCKPCGFLHHKGGCAGGAECNFCHLCPPGAIEQQRRMKRRLVRAARRCQANEAADAYPNYASIADTAAAAALAASAASSAAAAAMAAAAALHNDTTA